MFGTLKSIGAQDRTRYALAVDAVRAPNGQIVCRSTLTDPGNGCVPYNLFGIGVNTAAAVEYIQGRYGWNLQRLNQKVGAVNFAGEPFSTWAGPISTAFGYEYRREKMRQVVDPEEIANPTIWFQAAGQPYTGGFTVHDIYGETVVPLAKDAAWATALDFNGAVRFTHYSSYGSVVTYKAGMSWSPFDDLRFRFTQSRNIRSPTLVDLYQAGSTSRSSSTDTFKTPAVTITSQVTTRGNPNLGPEKSNDTGIGVVYQPSWWEGFSASVDYYRIEITDAVNSIGAQDLINFCVAGNTTACQSVIRTGTGTPQEQLEITVQPQNFATEMARGIDFEASYNLALSDVAENMDGTVGLRLLATHFMDYKVFSGIPGDIEIQYAGVNGSSAGLGGGSGGVPKWRVNAVTNYTLDALTTGFTWRWVSSGKNLATAIECTSGCPNPTAVRNTVNDNSVDGALFVDFNIAYTIPFGETAESQLFFNVRNIANRDPSIAVRGPGGTSFDFAPTPSGGAYDILGRVFRAGVKFRM
jgi:iron complex outermembrane receptor protein